VALVTTDLTLSLVQIVEYYGVRWKSEAGFREIKQEISRAETPTRTPEAVTNIDCADPDKPVQIRYSPRSWRSGLTESRNFSQSQPRFSLSSSEREIGTEGRSS
jgi:hypothetical protein